MNIPLDLAELTVRTWKRPHIRDREDVGRYYGLTTTPTEMLKWLLRLNI